MPLDHVTLPAPGDPFEQYNASSTLFFPVVERKLAWITKANDHMPVSTHKALVRVTKHGSPHVLSVVGHSYKLVHNRELFNRVEDTLRKQLHVQQLQGVQVRDRVSGWGRMCYREYIFPNIKCLLGGNTRSEIAFRLITQNGYGGSALRMHAGAIDFFCTNGMIRGEFQSTYRKHTSGLTVYGIETAVAKALASFVDSENLWRKWANTQVKHQAAMDLFKELATSAKLTENLQGQYLRERDQRGDNLWAVYSALTYYASHADAEFKLRTTTEQQDSVAATMMERELSVARWVETDAWKKLEYA